MIRSRENPIAYKAGALSFLVHGVLLGLLMLSFNWKVVQPASIATVELWDTLPTKPVVVQPPPKPVPPEPAPRVEMKPEPKPEPLPEPKAEIQVKKEPPKPEKPKEAPKKPEVIKPPEPKKPPAIDEDALKKLQQAMLEEDVAKPQASNSPAGPPSVSAANKGEVDKYIAMINNKIRRNVNEQLCGTGKPELEFALSLAPTGDIIGSPRMLKGSGLAACDASVERAILLAQPLPVPPQADLFAQFRDLKLKFHPKGAN
jgi:colicin import membrane protein